jgi:hypothetical protein
MLRSQQQLADWVRNHCGHGVTLWSHDLAVGPRFYLRDEPGPHGLDTFFTHYAKWEQWVVELEAKLYGSLVHPAPWVTLISRWFNTDRALRFAMLRARDGHPFGEFDLSTREAYTSGGQRVAQLSQQMTWCTESPTWAQVSDASQASVRRFASMFAEKVSALSIVGEPATPSVDATCERLATRAYVDLATFKTHLVQGEQLFRLGQWKPAAGMMRNAIEQLIDDVFVHVAPAAGLSATSVHDKVNGLCRHWGCGEVARYVYGTYALLSDVGSHPGDVEASRGERAWHAAIVALGEFTDHLP